MKKILIVITCILICVCACACSVREDSRLDGTYSAVQIGTGATFTFEGDGVTIKYTSAGEEVYTVTGTYEIYKDSITITLTGEDYEKGSIFAGVSKFERGDDYIVISGTRYRKQ